MKKISQTHLFVLVLISVIAAPSAFAGTGGTELEQLRVLVQELSQRVRELEHKNEIEVATREIDRKSEIAAEAAEAKKKETPGVSASEKGFGFKSADGDFEIKLRGVIQADYRQFQQGLAGAGTAASLTANANDTFNMRRIRPIIEGTVFGKYDFKITPEFGEDKVYGGATAGSGNSGIVDAYIDARFTPYFQVRAGKFKPYVGLERLQRAADTKFVERSYVTNTILPNRDIGASIHGDVLDDKLTYALGMYQGVADGGDNKTGADSNSAKDYAARVFATPFKGGDSPLAGLGLGIAVTSGSQVGTAATTELSAGYKTPGQQTFFKYAATAIADGRRVRWAPQANYYYGSLGVLAEYVRESQDVNLVAGAKHATLKHNAWQVATTYLLTGEEASFKGVRPKQVFGKGGWGAWELALRFAGINLDDKVYNYNGTLAVFADPRYSAKSARSYTAGVNWYLNSGVKLVLDYENTQFVGGGGGTAAVPLDRVDERAVLARFQVAF
ncbi:MAG: porin [Gallionellaceae bacterium]|nr:porin [Gallionellaceae bacterium]